MQPNPLEAGQIFDPEQVETVRRLNCRSYNACLTVACNERWRGFTCNGCSAHEPRTEDERRADLEGLAGVLRQVAPYFRIRRPSRHRA